MYHYICENDYVYFFVICGFMTFYFSCIHYVFLPMSDITTITYWMCHITDKTDLMEYFFANLYFNNFSCDPRMSFRILSHQFDTYPIYVSFASFLILNNTIDDCLRTRKMSDETKIIT